MCGLVGRIGTQPYRIVLDRYRAENGAFFETQTLALAKVTGITRDGDHISLNKFVYPIGQTVYDRNASVGSHTNSLLFLPLWSVPPVIAPMAAIY
jgi:hypothetical protein